MSFNTNWDVDQYRTEHECDEHWELRRAFILAHQDKFPEERLICLAQVFTNVEFLGCRYPQETMELIAELSEGVADDYREKQKSKLQRTFVKASDAAGAKVKGLKRPATEVFDIPSKITKCSDSSQELNSDGKTKLNSLYGNFVKEKVKSVYNSSTELESNFCGFGSDSAHESTNKSLDYSNNCVNGTVKKFSGMNVTDNSTVPCEVKVTQPMKETSHYPPLTDLKFGKFFLVKLEYVEDKPLDILNRSAVRCKVPFKVEYKRTESVWCSIYLNNEKVISVSNTEKGVAGEIAASLAVKKLEDVCYTVIIKQHNTEDVVVDKSTIISGALNSKTRDSPERENAMANRIPEDNIGSKLMRSMGWTGGGLGKTEQGIQEPISVTKREHRSGLGNKKTDFHSILSVYLSMHLSKYRFSGVAPKLIIKGEELTIEDKQIINLVARSKGFNCKRTGKGAKAHFVLSQNDYFAVAATEMIHRGVFSDERFEIVQPKCPSVGFVCEMVEASEDLQAALSIKHCSKRTVKTTKKKAKTEKRLRKQIRKQMIKEQETYSLDEIVVGPYGSFFLVEHEKIDDVPENIVLASANCNHIQVTTKYHKKSSCGLHCQVYVNKHLLTSVSSSSTKTVRDDALKDAYCKLKEICYTLKIKQEPMEISVTKDPTTQLPIAEFEPEKKTESSSLDVPMADNIGSKLMKSMGWTGGGLGKDQQGIQEPINLRNHGKRSGLGIGSNERRSFVHAVKILLQNYIDDDSSCSLAFSSDFSKEERAQMHMLAAKANLKSHSRNKGANRRLTISKKVDYCAIVERMLKSGNFVTENYELIKPCLCLPRETPIPRGVSSRVHENDSLCPNYISSNIDQMCSVETKNDHSVVSSEKQENCFPGFIKELGGNIIVNEFGRFILTDYENPSILELIKKSAQECNVLFEMQFVESKGPRLHECVVKLNGKCVSSAFGTSKKIAQRETLAKAMQKLREVCYSLKTEISKKKKQYSIVKRLIPPEINNGLCNTQILSCVSKTVNQRDLGFEGVQNLQPTVLSKKITSFVHNYIKEQSPHELVFTADFSSLEISSIEKIVSQLQVQKTVQHVSCNRFLVLSNYISPVDIAEAMLRSCVK